MRLTLDYPPVWLLGAMGLAWGGSLVHAPLGDALLWPGRMIIGLGLGVMVWAAWAFRQARTTIVPHENPSALVDTGPFRHSRNPIYVADLVILVGWCVSLGAPLGLVLLGPLWWVLHTRFVLPEEQRLTAYLGQSYIDYRGRVRRWI